jgi:hypothetical protein
LTKVSAVPPIFFAKTQCGLGEIVPQATKFPDLGKLFESCDDATIIKVCEIIGREARALGVNALACFPALTAGKEALLFSLSKKILDTNIYPVYQMASREALQIASPVKIHAMFWSPTGGRGADTFVRKGQSVVIADWDSADWQTQLLRGITLFAIPFEEAEESLQRVSKVLQQNHELKTQVCIAVDNNLRLKKRIAALSPAQAHPNRIYKVIGGPEAQRLSQKLFSTFR